ncbi:MAG: hypothetical protein JST39_25315 [Bacteroidetes bacterium]|nr:hypothetical protein [Bacteroidota bacterium]
MKKIATSCLIIIFIAGLGFSAAAQEESIVERPAKTAKWVSPKGYWMVETNIHEPRHSCIYFYNNDNTLVHKEVIDGIKMNVDNRRTKMKLKTALETAVDAWVSGHSARLPENLIAALFTK